MEKPTREQLEKMLRECPFDDFVTFLERNMAKSFNAGALAVVQRVRDELDVVEKTVELMGITKMEIP